MEEEYTKFIEILTEIITKLNSDYYQDKVDLTEFIETKKKEMEQYHKNSVLIETAETKYINELIEELK